MKLPKWQPTAEAEKLAVEIMAEQMRDAIAIRILTNHGNPTEEQKEKRLKAYKALKDGFGLNAVSE